MYIRSVADFVLLYLMYDVLSEHTREVRPK